MHAIAGCSVNPLRRCTFPSWVSNRGPLIDGGLPGAYHNKQLPIEVRHSYQSNQGVPRHPTANENSILTDEQITFARRRSWKTATFHAEVGVRTGSRKGAVERYYFRSLLQGFQESSFGVLPVFFEN